MARRYRQARRSESAEETRRRIVQATFDLHVEQGIAATSMRQIAQRAGVSVGSVYNHFPTYDDAINACGAHAFGNFPLPSADLFDGASRAERVWRLARAMFRIFDGMGGAFQSVIADQEKLPVLKPFVAQEQAARLGLAVAAAGEAAGPTLAALVDSATYDAFTRQGLTAEAAAARVAEIANAWLDTLFPEETA